MQRPTAPDAAATTSAGHGALAPFANPLFLGVWAANVASSLGGQLQQVGTSWLMVSLAPTPEMIALISSAITAPIFFFSLLSGAVADVMDRRKVLLVAQTFMFAVAAGLSLLSYADAVSPALLLVSTFLLFSGFALNAPAWQAVVGDLVSREQLSAAIALNTLGMNMARTIGPAIGGLIVGAFGSKAAFAANAISYVFLIVILLAWWRPALKTGAAPERVFAAVVAGVRYVAYSREVRPIISRAFWVGTGASAVTGLAPVVVSDVLHEGPVAFGTLLTSSGIGAILGASVSHALRVRFSYEGVSRVAIAVYAVGILGVALSKTLPLTGLAMMLTGASMVLSLSTFAVAVQSNVPRWVTGRAISIYQMAMFGGMTLGSIIWGQVAGRTGIPTALVCASIVMLFALLLGFRWPILSIDPDHLTAGKPTAGEGWSPAAEDPRAPLTVFVEYRIPSHAVQHFICLMGEQRRLRLRDGARRWGLLQDARVPERWIERFERRDLADYLRQGERRTHQDRLLDERLGALDSRDAGPEARFLFERSLRLTRGVLKG